MIRHVDSPGVDCLCLVCAGKRAADRHAVVEAMANITAIELMRAEIRANTDPEELK